ncbi:hypothetical protein VCHC17A1_3191B, partial [Vibrio cholerae HC-17A1]
RCAGRGRNQQRHALLAQREPIDTCGIRREKIATFHFGVIGRRKLCC